MPSLFNQLSLIRLLLPSLLIALWVTLSPGQSLTARAEIIHVNVNSTATTPDGTSWAQAFRHLQDALFRAENNSDAADEIWVAQGRYYPNQGQVLVGVDARNTTFNLRNGVAIYGGFSGSEGERIHRNWRTNITVLSGDVDKNDTTDTNGIVTSTDNIAGNNAFHVVTSSGVESSAVLDGFTITAGQATGPVFECAQACGGGLFNNAGNPTLANLTFSANVALSGGGLYHEQGNLTLTNVIFKANSATSCGGINNASGDIVLTNVAFNGNKAVDLGGGMCNTQGNPTLTNVVFNANSAKIGGGLDSDSGNPVLTNVTFSANSALEDGGGVFIRNDDASFTNVIIWGNQAAEAGSIAGAGAVSSTANFSLIEGFDLSNIGIGNLNGNDPIIDPIFARNGDPSTDPPTPGDLRLQTGSSAIDAGSLDGVTVLTDVAGNPRVQNGNIDMGAYEARFCPEGGILYVKPGGAGLKSGDSWENAYAFLQDALGVVGPCEIWVAAGTHLPDEGFGQIDNDSSSTFRLKSNVAIYGGFNGTETERSQRNWEANRTALSGDIDQNDTSGSNIPPSVELINGNNADTVVTASDTDATAILDGFTITAGQARNGCSTNSPCVEDFGGGMFNLNSNPRLTNIIFSVNRAIHGGGIFNLNSSPSLVNVTFNANVADSGRGLVNRNAPTTATSGAASLLATESGGGGMYNASNSNPTLTNVAFNANSTGDGGSGGGMLNEQSSPILRNVLFNANSATSGGGMANRGSNPELTNVTISANVANNGGGMDNTTSTPTLTNVIAWGNQAENGLSIANDQSEPVINFSLVELEDLSSIGSGNLNGADPANEPRFVRAGDPLTDPPTPGDLRLSASSPLINAGEPDALTVFTDLDGHPRIQNGRMDMGAYETLTCPDSGKLYVTEGGAGSKKGTSWENAFDTLQDALIVRGGCEIWVAQGVYYPDFGSGQREDNRASTFQLKDNVAIYGGFVGGETERSQRDWRQNVTVLSGDIDQNDVVDANMIVTATTNITGNNAFHVVTSRDVGHTAVLDGFAITAGNSDNPGLLQSDTEGGGMFNVSSSPTLANLDFSANMAFESGGGMFISEGAPTLTNIMFRNNRAASGGGLFIIGGNPQLINTVFAANSAIVSGGGMSNDQSNPALINVTFNANVASSGGAIANNNSSPSLTNTIIWENRVEFANPSILNLDASSQPTVNFSLIEGNDFSGSGTGNLDGTDSAKDPLFVQNGAPATDPPTPGNLRLQADSPAINAGSTISFTTITSVTTDLGGNPRVQGPSIDMGAYEFSSESSTPSDILMVNSADDSDDGQCDAAHCSLREAINATNQATVPMTITFNLPISNGLTIAPTSPLPTLENAMTIDGTSQSGASCNRPLVTLDGSSTGVGIPGLQINAAGATVQGLSIVNYAGSAIVLNSEFAEVTCNHLGQQVDGTLAGNGEHGVHILDSAINNTVGGKDRGNFIANNSGDGVRVDGAAATGNFIAENTIFGNGNLGIDLGGDGVTINDSGDGDGGANNQQNHPILTAAVSNGLSTTITGTLNSLPNIRYLVEFYANDAGASCQGQSFVGFTFVTTDDGGNSGFNTALPVTFATGQTLAATASAIGTDDQPATFDTSEFSACQPITVTNSPFINTGPVANPQTINIDAAQPQPFTLSGSDADGDPLTFAIFEQPANGTVSLEGAVATYIPNAGFVGDDSFTFIVNDGEVNSAPARVNVAVLTVLPVNTTPVANPQTVNVTADQPISFTLTGSDADGDALSFSIDRQPLSGTVSLNGVVATYAPLLGFVGQDSFTVVANDGIASSTPATVTVQVSAPGPSDPDPDNPDPGSPNTAPVADEILVDIPGATKPIILGGSDADGDSLTFAIITLPANGGLTGTAPNLTYTPNDGFSGTDSFTYTVNDGTVDSAPATVTIQVESTPGGAASGSLFLPFMPVP